MEYANLKDSLIFGLLGPGQHARKVVVKAFADAKIARLSAIAANSTEQQAELEKELPSLSVYSNNEALLADSSISAVYICLPNSLHAHWTLKSLQAGKHVLCEKPLCLDSREAQQIEEASLLANKTVFEAFMYRFHPQHAQVKELLQSDAIGQVQLLDIRFHYCLDDATNIRLRKDSGGGSLLDVGCYTFDCARFLLEEEPLRISGNWSLNSDTQVDESACFQLVFPSGATAQTSCAINSPRANLYTIYGTKGVIRVESAFRMPRKKTAVIELQTSKGNSERIRVEPANQYSLQLDAFSNWVLCGRKPKEAFGNAFQNTHVLDAARRAALSGQTIELD